MGRYSAYDRDMSFDEAFRYFEEAETWEKANLYLFEFRELILSVKAFSRVKQRIAESSAQEDTSSVFYWQLQLTWLKEAKEYGIQRAWIRLMKRWHQAELAVKALVDASPEPEMLPFVVEEWQDILLSDAAIFQLSDAVTHLARHHQVLAARLDQVLASLLLERYQAHNRWQRIISVWKRFNQRP